MKSYQCIVCGFVYDESLGLPAEGIAPGTRWADIPGRLGMPGLRRRQGRLRDGRDLTAHDRELPHCRSSSSAAGSRATPLAREFRKLDKQTPLVIVSRDHAGFYSKPMLSNALAGRKTAATLVMKPAAKMAEELPATVRAHAEVRRIDTAARTVHLARARRSPTATWCSRSAPTRSACRSRATARPTCCRSTTSTTTRASPSGWTACRRVAILGGGLIGCEFANDLLARGIAPTVIDPAAWPLSRLLPPAAGAGCASGWRRRACAFASASRRAGSSARASGYTLRPRATAAASRPGSVLSAIGLRPRTGLAHDAGLASTAASSPTACSRHRRRMSTRSATAPKSRAIRCPT